MRKFPVVRNKVEANLQLKMHLRNEKKEERKKMIMIKMHKMLNYVRIFFVKPLFTIVNNEG